MVLIWYILQYMVLLYGIYYSTWYYYMVYTTVHGTTIWYILHGTSDMLLHASCIALCEMLYTPHPPTDLFCTRCMTIHSSGKKGSLTARWNTEISSPMNSDSFSCSSQKDWKSSMGQRWKRLSRFTQLPTCKYKRREAKDLSQWYFNTKWLPIKNKILLSLVHYFYQAIGTESTTDPLKVTASGDHPSCLWTHLLIRPTQMCRPTNNPQHNG